MAAGRRDTKVVLVGSMGVGKTCLSIRLSKGEFCGDVGATLGASLVSLPCESGGEINIWDTAGQERYFSLVRMYYRGAALIMLCFDLHNVQAEQLQRRAKDLVSHADPGAKILLVGAKADKVEESGYEAACAQAKEACAVAGLKVDDKVIITSAKTGAGIDDLRAQLQALCGPEPTSSSRGAFGLFGGERAELGEAAASSRGCCS